MSNMMEKFVTETLKQELKSKYPHIQHPPCVCAKVVRVTDKDGIYDCTLNILDKNMDRDTQFPEIPGVYTELSVKKGDKVVVLMLYGECNPYIVGRCI